ncbi:PIN domain-containing protein [Haloactinomyces albus]|uniref:PIN domain nuclease of toxin-antitoxin system n=1 Tax=Haloactinomyces albus TaxID=1352928 RepID=A0AAE3ZJ85_9ACTN|nr:type II toxin-antitoxin system VapC family toxin [Haloactinomyces albus]MDR7304639.1 PIN domain nuclease of toxin-antitoxin system [Haloactinomyces albus]
MSAVLDASALMAWLRDEDGADQVDEHIEGGVIGAVNLSEVAQKISQHGGDGSRAAAEVLGMGLVLTPFAGEDALATAELWPRTHAHGLSLGDRACLALAHRLDRPALTADQAWKTLDLDVEIQLIR